MPRLCLAASCGDKKKSSSTTGTPVCTANTTVDCGAVPAAQVNGATFVTGLATATCAADGKSWDTSKCTPIAQGNLIEGDICDPTGSQCSTGLTCTTVTAGIDDQGNPVTTGVCFTTCKSSADCSGGEDCFPVWSATDPVCSQTNQLRDTVCGYGGECEPTLDCLSSINFGQECKQPCAANTVGTAGVCTNGELCLQSDLIAIQLTAAFQAVTCTSPDNTPCDTANGYTCVASGGQVDFCVLNPAVCGTPIPVTTSNFTAPFAPAAACDLPGFSQYCGPLAGADAAIQPQCVQQGGGVFVQTKGSGGSDVTCTDATDCAFVSGFDCLELSGSGGSSVQECAIPSNFCVAPCGDIKGVSLGSCGAGFTCTQPADFINVTLFVPQPPDAGDTTDTAKKCTTVADCVTGQGMQCINIPDGQFCIRPRSVCTST